jgi:hypothetical protein
MAARFLAAVFGRIVMKEFTKVSFAEAGWQRLPEEGMYCLIAFGRTARLPFHAPIESTWAGALRYLHFWKRNFCKGQKRVDQ